MDRNITKKESYIRQILKREWEFFQQVHHTEGRAECQNNPVEFEIMRRSQWETLPCEILESYLEDLILAKHKNQNLVQDKYARMMEFSAPAEFELIKSYLPEISLEKKEIIEKIEYINEIRYEYIHLASKARPLYSKDDTPNYTSIETYLKGELSSYSLKTLKLYYNFILEYLNQNKNLALENIQNIVLKKGFSSLEEAENIKTEIWKNKNQYFKNSKYF